MPQVSVPLNSTLARSIVYARSIFLILPAFLVRTRHHICPFFLHKNIFKIMTIYPQINLKYYIFDAFIHFIVIISQFSLLYTLSMGKTWFNIAKNWIILHQLDLKHIYKVNFYPSDNNFTQALLVTNMISGLRTTLVQRHGIPHPQAFQLLKPQL